MVETGAIDQTPRSVTEIARRSGLIAENARLGGDHRKQITGALSSRPDIGRLDEIRRGHKTTLYRVLDVM